MSAGTGAASDRHDGFSISFSGVSGPLVRKTTNQNVSHPMVSGATYWEYETQQASDLRVWRVEQPALKNSTTGNGDHWVTWWEVTAGDGTLYVFGRERVFEPDDSQTGSPATARDRKAMTTDLSMGGAEADRSNGQLHSAQVVPVHVPGQGCTDNLCELAVVWNLDQVLDTSGNMAVYQYWTEQNYYRPKVGTVNRLYEKQLNRRYIDYARFFGDPPLPKTPASGADGNYRVKFDYMVRNVQNDYLATFFDTPTDLECGVNDTCAEGAPAFYSLHRLTLVTPQHWDAANNEFKHIRHYALGQNWPSPPGESGWPVHAQSLTKMTLSYIADGGPGDVWWEYTWKPNRVNHHGISGNEVPQMQMPRISKYHNELGGVAEFVYGQSHPPSLVDGSACDQGSTPPPGGYVRLPCDMYRAIDPFTGSGGVVLWHKWKVLEKKENPAWGGSQVMTETYTYLDPPEWALGGGTGHGPHATSRVSSTHGTNFWNDYRGHRRVRVTDDTGAYVDHYFYTGMENDRATDTNSDLLVNVPSAVRHNLVDVQDPLGNWVNNTYEQAGRPLGTITYNADDEVVSRQAVWYWTTTVHDPNGAGGKFTDLAMSYKTIHDETIHELNDQPGGTVQATNHVVTNYDDHGLPTYTRDFGNAGASDDRTTFYHYAKNTAAANWVVNTPSLIATRAGIHTSTPWNDWISATAYLYDGGLYGAAPTFGRVTTELLQTKTTTGIDPEWTATTYAYHPKGQVHVRTAAGDSTTSTDDQVFTTLYDDDFGYVTSVDGPLGAQDDFTYVADPAHGNPTQVTDPNGGITSLTYDNRGRLTTVTPPGYAQPTLKHTYTTGHWLTANVHTENLRETSGSNQYVDSWSFVDGFGRPIQTQTRPSSGNDVIVTASRYDYLGRLLADTDPAQQTGTPGVLYGINWANPAVSHRRYVYTTDANDDPQITTGCKRGTNTRTVFYGADNLNWDSTRTTQCGLTHRSWDEHNHQTTTFTDIRGNVTGVTNPLGEDLVFTYNLRDQLVTVSDDDSNVTTYTYTDWSNNYTSLDDPDLGTINYAYDDHQRLRTQTDARGVALTVTWDNANRPTNLDHGTDPVSQWWYDPAGHAGQLDKVAHWNRDTNGVGLGYVEQRYTYEANTHRLEDATWSIQNMTGGDQTITYDYRPSGAIEKITYPNSEEVIYTYNTIEQPVSVTVGGQTIGRNVTYDAAGRITNLDRGTGANQLDTTYTYNANTNRLDSLVTRDDTATVLQDLSYAYTPGGYVERITDNTPGVGQTHCVIYDTLLRLYRGWTRTDANCTNTATDNNGPDPYLVQYFYDNIGNIEGAWGTNIANSDYEYNAGPAHAPSRTHIVGNTTRSFTYDAAGNRTSQTHNSQTTNYIYDLQNRLVDINGTAAIGLLYGAGGERVRRAQSGTTSWYLGHTYEHDGTAVMIHVDIAGQRLGSWIHDGNAAVVSTTAGDHLGSASVARSSSVAQTQRYQPFGQVRGGGPNSLPTDHGYTGQRHDNASGLYYYEARYYDPVIGQFTQPDSVTPSPSRSSDWNRFAYVRNSPLSFIDPTGHCSANPAERDRCDSATSGRGTPLRTWLNSRSACAKGNATACRTTRSSAGLATLSPTLEDRPTGCSPAFPCWVPPTIATLAGADHRSDLADDLREFDRIAFRISDSEFRDIWEDAAQYPQFDWTNDGCSDRNIVSHANSGCIRHDWIYRNISLIDQRHELHGVLRTNSHLAKGLADANLLADIAGSSDPMSWARAPIVALGVSLFGASFFAPYEAPVDGAGVYGDSVWRVEP
ncbi:MAG: RHS repeat-associated core domain-containing protein [Actinomycetota bacterium]